MNIEKSEKFYKQAVEMTPGGVHSPVRAFRGVGGVPRFVQSAKGAEIVDVDGNRYLDFCLAFGPLLFGHQDPEVLEAVQASLHRGWSYGTAEPYSLELSEMITQSLPWVQKLRFVNSGTEAVMAALRVARAATGRHKIVKFDGCYHGHTDSMLVKAGSGLAEMASPDSAGVSASVAAETIVAPLNDIPKLKEIFELHGNEIAALIVEPIPANNGLLLQKDDFLHEIAAITRKNGSLLIFDEVITGFRVAFGGMAEKTGIQPDLVTYGKIIGGGFPVGAYGGRADLMNWVAPVGPVYQAGTLSANPIAMVAGMVNLKKLKRDNPYAVLEKRTADLSNALQETAHHLDIPLKMQSSSSLFWGVFGGVNTSDGFVRSHDETSIHHKTIYAKVFHRLLEKGVYLAPSAFEVCFISTAHRPEQLEFFKDAMKSTLKELREAKEL